LAQCSRTDPVNGGVEPLEDVMSEPAPQASTPAIDPAPIFINATASANDLAFTLARESVAAYARSWAALTEFAAQAGTFYDPAKLAEAQMRFWAHLTDLGAEAAAERLRNYGIKTQLLNDA
jgi:hypothetical protein